MSGLSAVLSMMLLATPAVSAAPLERDAQVLAQMTIEQRVIIRVPIMPLRPPRPLRAAPPVIQWEERGSPKCLRTRDIKGAVIERGQTLHLVFSRVERYRIELDRSCRAADFYSGFYLEPTDDGKICARRDTLHSRAGASCEISRFRELTPQREP